MRADRIPNEDLRQAHAEAKAALLERVRRIGGQALDPALPLLGFATRNASFFNSHRMMRRNAVEAHLR